MKINPLQNRYNSFNIQEFSKLCEASKNGDLNYLKKLYNCGVNMSQSDYDGRTALHLACCEGHTDVVKFLINIVNVNREPIDRWNNKPIDDALTNGHLEIMNLLSENNFDDDIHN